MRRVWPLLVLLLADCRRKHAPIAEEAPPAATRDLSAPLDLAIAAAAPSPDLAGARTAPPTEAEVRAALRPVLDGIARCVTRALPPLGATLTLRFELEPGGRLTGGRVDGVTGADACVQQLLDAVLTPIFSGPPEHVAIPLGRDGKPIPIPAADGGA